MSLPNDLDVAVEAKRGELEEGQADLAGGSEGRAVSERHDLVLDLERDLGCETGRLHQAAGWSGAVAHQDRSER